MGRAAISVATGGRRCVGTGWGEGWLFGSASGKQWSSCRFDYRGGPEREVRVDN